MCFTQGLTFWGFKAMFFENITFKQNTESAFHIIHNFICSCQMFAPYNISIPNLLTLNLKKNEKEKKL